MNKRAAGPGRKQEKTPVTMSVAMRQLVLPLLLAMDATKKMISWEVPDDKARLQRFQIFPGPVDVPAGESNECRSR